MECKKKRSARILSLTLALALCGAPELLGAAAQAQTVQPPASSPAGEQNGAQAQPAPLPDAPSTQQQTPDQNNSRQNQNNQNNGQKPPAQPAQAPAGVGAAQAGPTAGGAGSKPAGMAIAPAKQRQVRSFLIKLGAIAGGALAIGTVYALSRSSPSRPPGAK